MDCTRFPSQIFKDYVGDLQFSFGKGAGNYPTSTWVPVETARKAYYSSCSSEVSGKAYPALFSVGEDMIMLCYVFQQ